MPCSLFHKWDGCKCRKCGALRNKHHKGFGRKCQVCGKEIYACYGKFIEYRDTGGCSRCSYYDACSGVMLSRHLRREPPSLEHSLEHSLTMRLLQRELYWQGSTKLQLLTVSLQCYDNNHYMAIDRHVAIYIVNQIIPGIEPILPHDIRILHATNYDEAFKNAAVMTKEKDNSEGSFIFGEMGVQLEGIEIWFALTLLVNGYKEAQVTIMKKSSQWSENLKIMR